MPGYPDSRNQLIIISQVSTTPNIGHYILACWRVVSLLFSAGKVFPSVRAFSKAPTTDHDLNHGGSY